MSGVHELEQQYVEHARIRRVRAAIVVEERAGLGDADVGAERRGATESKDAPMVSKDAPPAIHTPLPSANTSLQSGAADCSIEDVRCHRRDGSSSRPSRRRPSWRR